MQLNKSKEKSIEDIQKELKDKTITHPFEDDLLGLKPFAETISNIVVSTKDSFVFSINSPYGTGKTFFLRRLHCLLEQKGCLCVSYNAWESDFYDNPLPAIISALERRTTTQKVVDMGKQAVKNLSKMKINPLKNIIEEFSILFEKKEKIYDDFKKYQEAKEKFIKDLSNFVKNKKLVFIIDELDRCRPDYAIKTLEVIKHFFNIPNINFIIGVDRKQIESTVKVLYGANIDNNCDEYLRKFIDQDFYLPHSSIDHYIEFLCKEYLTEVLSSFNEDRHTFSILNFEKLFSNIPLYSNSTPNKIDIRFILEVFCTNLIELCKFFNFSLRKQEQLVSLIKIFISSLNPKTDYLFPELICYLVSIRMVNYEYLKYENLLEILTTDPFVPEDEKIKWQNTIGYKSTERTFPSLKNKSIKGDAVDFWRAILKGEELKMEIKDYVLANFIGSASFSKIKSDAKKYLLLIKRLTILTTEKK